MASAASRITARGSTADQARGQGSPGTRLRNSMLMFMEVGKSQTKSKPGLGSQIPKARQVIRTACTFGHATGCFMRLH